MCHSTIQYLIFLRLALNSTEETVPYCSCFIKKNKGVVKMKTYIMGAGSSYEFGYPLGKDIFPKAKEMAYSEVQSSKSDEAKHLLRAYENVKKSLKDLIINSSRGGFGTLCREYI